MATAERARGSQQMEEFQACVADYRAALAELREIEERMTRCVRTMRAEGVPRERLVAASVIVGNLRGALNASRMQPAVDREQEKSGRAQEYAA